MQNPQNQQFEQIEMFRRVEQAILSKPGEELPDRMATAVMRETHMRQFNTICGMLGELEHYAIAHRSHLPVLNSIVYQANQLYCLSNEVCENINLKIIQILQGLLIDLCKCINTQWIQLQLSLNRILVDFNRQVEKTANLATNFVKAWLKKKYQLPPVEIEFLPNAEINRKNEDVCGICLETHKKKQTVTCPCSHSFGKKCFKGWMQTCQRNQKDINCPSCRQGVHILKEFRENK